MERDAADDNGDGVVGRLGASRHRGQSSSQHNGKDWKEPCWSHGLDGKGFAGKEEVVLENRSAKSGSGIDPEDYSQADEKPRASRRNAVFLDVRNQSCKREEERGNE